MGVIILLGIIALITLTVVNKNIKKSEKVLYNVQIENIKDGAKNWSVDNIKALPNDGEVYLTLAQLKQGGYVEDNIKSPSNNKMCFPNDLEIEIKASLSGSYEYKVNTDNITYVSCDDEDFDRNSPYIILAKGDVINKNNEVIDYVEVDQNGIYTVPLAYAYDQNGSLITDSSAFSATLYYKDEGNSTFIKSKTYKSSNGSITFNIDDIKKYKRIYKIEYSVNYDNKVVKAIRNIILQDMNAPEITFSKSDDTVLYYNENGVTKFIDYVFSSANVKDNSSSTACVQGYSGNCYYELKGVEEINSYFNSEEFKAMPQSDYVNFSKEFPVIVTATDASGNTSKKTQNVTIVLKEAKEPNLKLMNEGNNIIYDSDNPVVDEDDEIKWYSDEKFKVKVASGCPIDLSSSYYVYNGTNINLDAFNITNKYEFAFDINLEEGQKDLEIYTTCSSDVDRTIFTNIEAVMQSTTMSVDWYDPICSIVTDPLEPNGNNDWYITNPNINIILSDTNGLSGTFSNNGIITDISTNFTQNITITEDGSYTYTLEGTDVAGKQCSTSKKINVDTEAPTVTFTKQDVYPTRKKFVSKVYGGSGVTFDQFTVYSNGSSLSYGNISSIDILHCSNSKNGNGLITYGTSESTKSGDYWGGSTPSATKVNMTTCLGDGNVYVRDSGISINLKAAYPISKWYVHMTSSKYFTDYCSYDDSNQSYSVSNYKKGASYCSDTDFNNYISNGKIYATKTFSNSLTNPTQTASFIEKKITNLSISYSDNFDSNIESHGISSVREIKSDKTATATDKAGNSASCTYISSTGKCSCTSGTCMVNY